MDDVSISFYMTKSWTDELKIAKKLLLLQLKRKNNFAVVFGKFED